MTWAPTNANGYFTGDSMPLRTAFAQSVNSVAVKLGQEVGIKNIANTAHAMGIKSQLDPTPALALGSSDVNLLELVNSYCTVVNDGRAHEAVLVTRILDRDGNEIYTAPTEQRQVIPYRSAFLMQQMLQAGLRERGATSMSLWGYVRNFPDTEFGGKTGTSNNHSDAWFVGVSPNLVCGAWVGGEYRSIHFRTGAAGTGFAHGTAHLRLLPPSRCLATQPSSTSTASLANLRTTASSPTCMRTATTSMPRATPTPSVSTASTMASL